MDFELFSIPDLCPACSSPTFIKGDFLYCKSKRCPAKLSGLIKVWVERLGLLHWGDALIEALTDSDNPKIQSISDLYRLSVEDLANYCSGVKVAQKCYDILHANKTVPIELLLSAINIPNLGISTATDIIQAGFDTVDKILAITFSDLIKIPNVGEIPARQIADGIMEKREMIIELSEVLNIQEPIKGFLKKTSFCITGELSQPRKAIQKAILEAGGVVKTSVTASLSYLVTNNPDTTSSKMKKAKKYEVPVINEDQLNMLLVGR
jgi:DNA ligase (NAD+)